MWCEGREGCAMSALGERRGGYWLSTSWWEDGEKRGKRGDGGNGGDDGTVGTLFLYVFTL